MSPTIAGPPTSNRGMSAARAARSRAPARCAGSRRSSGHGLAASMPLAGSCSDDRWLRHRIVELRFDRQLAIATGRSTELHAMTIDRPSRTIVRAGLAASETVRPVRSTMRRADGASQAAAFISCQRGRSAAVPRAPARCPRGSAPCRARSRRRGRARRAARRRDRAAAASSWRARTTAAKRASVAGSSAAVDEQTAARRHRGSNSSRRAGDRGAFASARGRGASRRRRSCR